MTKEFLVTVDIARTLTFRVHAEDEKEAYKMFDRIPDKDIKITLAGREPIYNEEFDRGFDTEYVKHYADDDGVYVERFPYKEVMRVSEIVDKWDCSQEPPVTEKNGELPF